MPSIRTHLERLRAAGVALPEAMTVTGLATVSIVVLFRNATS